MKVSSAIIEVLDENNVGTVFSLMSDDIMGITSTIKESQQEQLSVVENRHEQQAVAMANAYAQSSGSIGVCILGRGPAIAQTGTALVTARKQGTPLLVLTAASATTETSDIKGFSQESYLESTVGNVTTVNDPAAVVPALTNTFHRLYHAEGPVAIQIAKNVIDGPVGPENRWQDEQSLSQAPTFEQPRVEPTDAAIDDLVDAYLESDATIPPVILVGRGAVEAGARNKIEALAERMGATIVTTLRAQGYFHDHPFSAGFVGTIGSNLANELLTKANFVLALGASLNKHTTDHGWLLDEATVVHVDTKPGNINRHTDVDLGIIADVTETTEQLTAELTAMDIEFHDKFWTENLKRRIEETSPLTNREFPTDPNRIDPRNLLRELDNILPAERNVVLDAGHFSYWVFDGITIPDPEGLVWPIEFAAIGLGLASGIGTAIADEDRTTVTFCGDAGSLMAIQELDTAVRYGVPIIIVVMNDDALGAEYAQLKQKGWYADAGRVSSPDLAAIAEGFGASGYTVRSVTDIERLRTELDSKPSGPVLVDCKVNPDVIHRRFTP